MLFEKQKKHVLSVLGDRQGYRLDSLYRKDHEGLTFSVHPHTVLHMKPTQTWILPAYSYPLHWQGTFLQYLKIDITIIILFFPSNLTWVDLS